MRFSTKPTNKESLNKSKQQEFIQQDSIVDSQKIRKVLTQGDVEEAASLESILYLTKILLSRFAPQKKSGSGLKYDIPFLEGPPGTGKTHVLEFIAPKWIKSTYKIVNHFNKVLEENRITSNTKNYSTIEDYMWDNLEKLIDESNLDSEIKSSFIKHFEHLLKTNNPLPMGDDMKKIFDKLLQRGNMLQDTNDKSYYIMSIHTYLRELNTYWQKLQEHYNGQVDEISKMIVNQIDKLSKTDPLLYKIVLPSQEVSTEFVEEPLYLISSDKIIETKKRSNFIDVVYNAVKTGTPTIFILDEMSELPVRDNERSAKSLHDFLDSWINEESLSVGISRGDIY